MKTLRFIIYSYIFKYLLAATAGFFIMLQILNKAFDLTWKSECMMPVTNLNDVYRTPLQYDNFSKFNLILEAPNKLNIEANKKFIIAGSTKPYDYYHTVSLTKPGNEHSHTNKIYIYFENASTPDSLYFVISKSTIPEIYWNQIFYSSVRIENLNRFSEDTSDFRLHPNMIVSKELLENNDSLIDEAVHYFNINRDSLGLKECGTNCFIFESICDKFSVPCRRVELQGGDATEPGYDNKVGYPLHVVCEVYSSRYGKWYVLDPTYGSAYSYKNIPLNAVEISNKVFFSREKEIIVDSVLTTKDFPVNIDYFRYYENVFFESHFHPNWIVKEYLRLLYQKYNYGGNLYSNKLVSIKNAREYFMLKSFTYLIITVIYVNIVIFILTRRLFKSKRPNTA